MQNEIMHHAIKRFNSEGATFKLDDVAADMKISKKTIYKSYKNKEALIEGIIDNLFKEVKTKEHEITCDDRLDSLDKLMGILSVYPDYEHFNYTHIPTLRATYPNLYEKLEMQLESNWDETFKLLDHCVAEGRVRPISHDLFKLIFVGLYKQLLLTEDSEPQKRMRICIEHIFNGLKNN